MTRTLVNWWDKHNQIVLLRKSGKALYSWANRRSWFADPWPFLDPGVRPAWYPRALLKNKITMCGVRYWNSSCTGRSASAWKQLRMMSQQEEWPLRVILRLIYCARNEPASCEIHLGGKVVVFALAALSGPLCLDLQPACAVSGDSCLVAIAKVQGCHLLRDSLHVQVFGMAPDVSTAIQVVGSSESDTEVVSDPSSVYDSQHLPQQALSTVLNMILLCLLRQVLSLVHWLTRQCFRRRALICLKSQLHLRKRRTRQSMTVADTAWKYWCRRAQLRRLMKVVLRLLQLLFPMRMISPCHASTLRSVVCTGIRFWRGTKRMTCTESAQFAVEKVKVMSDDWPGALLALSVASPVYSSSLVFHRHRLCLMSCLSLSHHHHKNRWE